jgi:hypothetical protein
MKKRALFTSSTLLLASLNAQEIPITGKAETHIGNFEITGGIMLSHRFFIGII